VVVTGGAFQSHHRLHPGGYIRTIAQDFERALFHLPYSAGA
jgi:hypothetical protein